MGPFVSAPAVLAWDNKHLESWKGEPAGNYDIVLGAGCMGAGSSVRFRPVRSKSPAASTANEDHPKRYPIPRPNSQPFQCAFKTKATAAAHAEKRLTVALAGAYERVMNLLVRRRIPIKALQSYEERTVAGSDFLRAVGFVPLVFSVTSQQIYW